LNVITSELIENCIEKLLEDENNELNLEFLCKLLTAIGVQFDKEPIAIKANHIFGKLEAILKNRKLVSDSIRLKIIELIDLKKNNWVPQINNGDKQLTDEIIFLSEVKEPPNLLKKEPITNQQVIFEVLFLTKLFTLICVFT